jgi:hypothetical protein
MPISTFFHAVVMVTKMSDNGRPIFMLAVALIMVFIIAVYVPPLFQKTPVVEVSNCVLTADTISNNGTTSITFTLKSNDKQNAHVITVQFSSYPLVYFMLGSQNLPIQNGVYQYIENLNPSATSTQHIDVHASLENGIAKIDYAIGIVFLLDGQQAESKNLTLTVQR